MDAPISAGDVGRFAYCPLNWKRSHQGEPGKGGEAGMRAHGELAGQVDALEYYQYQSFLTSSTSLYLALLAISASALGLEIFFLRHSRLWWWWTLVFLSVLWLAVSLYMFVFHLYYDHKAGDLVRRLKIQPGSTLFGDSRKTSDVLESRVLPLRGKPDYVVERGGAVVPVLTKTGRTPPRPYDSHVVQLAAYCFLVNESSGRRPPHGVLSYPDRSFEISYTKDLEDRLLRTLMRIQLAQRTGEAHRDHESPGRCANCSRRDGCPERLDASGAA